VVRSARGNLRVWLTNDTDLLSATPARTITHVDILLAHGRRGLRGAAMQRILERQLNRARPAWDRGDWFGHRIQLQPLAFRPLTKHRRTEFVALANAEGGRRRGSAGPLIPAISVPTLGLPTTRTTPATASRSSRSTVREPEYLGLPRQRSPPATSPRSLYRRYLAQCLTVSTRLTDRHMACRRPGLVSFGQPAGQTIRNERDGFVETTSLTDTSWCA